MNSLKLMTVGAIANYFSFTVNVAMIFGPCFAYLLQAEKFKSIHSSKGFSLYVCLIILVANILRIYFWIGKRFTPILLAQSILVITSQLYLIYVSLEKVEYLMTITSKPDKKQLNNELKERNLIVFLYNNIKTVYKTLFSIETFWKWESFSLYVITIIMGSIAMGVICLIFGFDNIPFVELIGSISTGVEVIIAIPQIVCNYKNKSTETLSFLMIMLWLFGDSFKLIYYIVTQSVIQFIVCSIIQIALDFILIGQIFYYDYCKQKKKEPNGIIIKEDQKDSDGYGTFAYSADEEEITIKSKVDEDDIIIKDY